MKVVVCVRQGLDGELSPFDASAYEAALRLTGAEVTLLSMAPQSAKDFLLRLTRLGAKKAILHYKKIAEKETDMGWLTLAEIKLETGRHHQIRVQTSHAGFPIWGDKKYQKFRRLNSCQLSWQRKKP